MSTAGHPRVLPWEEVPSAPQGGGRPLRRFAIHSIGRGAQQRRGVSAEPRLPRVVPFAHESPQRVPQRAALAGTRRVRKLLRIHQHESGVIVAARSGRGTDAPAGRRNVKVEVDWGERRHALGRPRVGSQPVT
jgi:hypothetical protein